MRSSRFKTLIKFSKWYIFLDLLVAEKLAQSNFPNLTLKKKQDNKNLQKNPIHVILQKNKIRKTKTNAIKFEGI